MGTNNPNSNLQGLTRRELTATLLAGGTAAIATGAHATGAQAKPRALPKVRRLSDKFGELKLGALIVTREGRRVHAEGDLSKQYLMHSMRKSLMSMLYGIAVKSGDVKLDATIASLGLDDTPPLNDIEKTATVKDLLMARSGVYIPAPAESAGMKARRPVRGSHVPGTFWYYNNWDFNALGNIYEQITGKSVFIAFEHWIAKLLDFQDFRIFEDSEYDYEIGASRFPAYSFQMSARDLERVGNMMLNGGNWQGKSIVPADWVTESTQSYSKTNYGDALSGYGYLWWISAENTSGAAVPLPVGGYTAAGYGGHYMTVFPSLKMVVIARVDDQNVESPIGTPNNYSAFLHDVLAAVT